jgi:hypothetical protein
MSVPTKGVIPGREVCAKIDGFVNFAPTSEPGTHNHDSEYGFRGCAFQGRLSPTGSAHPGMTLGGSVAFKTAVSEVA